MKNNKHPEIEQNTAIFNPAPGTWLFDTFLCGPTLIGVYYYLNSKIIGSKQEGLSILISTIFYSYIFPILFSNLVNQFILVYYLIEFLGVYILGKRQLKLYTEQQKEKNLNNTRNAVPLFILFFVLNIVWYFAQKILLSYLYYKAYSY